ncbi:MAG: hypothetical protein ACOYLF_16940, partial [Blastocatellia bacterium]
MGILKNLKLLVCLLVMAGIGLVSVEVSRAGRLADPPVHWAFIPPVRSSLPTVKDGTWSRTPIDRFVLAAIEKQG